MRYRPAGDDALRFADDDPAAEPVAQFLLSDDAGYITGAAIPVDGGYLST